jgi:hypothetical protein
MNVIKNNRIGLIVGETEKSYRVKPVADKAVWWPKSQCRVDHGYYESQLAMHLWAGYASEDDSIASVARISAFVPALILADRKLDRQLDAGRTDWDRVFCYDVAQEAGAWLAANPTASVAAFTAKVEGLIA